MHTRLIAAAVPVCVSIFLVTAFLFVYSANADERPSLPRLSTWCTCVLADAAAAGIVGPSDGDTEIHPAGEPPSRKWLSYLGPWLLAGLLLAIALAIAGVWLVFRLEGTHRLEDRGLGVTPEADTILAKYNAAKRGRQRWKGKM